VGFPCSSVGSDHAGRDRSSAALPYFAISNAKNHLEASAMPPQNGLRLNYLGRTEKARPELGYQYE
jgi:hypothetical protein